MTARLRLLGTVGLTDSDGRDVRAVLAQPKRLALLVYLAVAQPPGFHRRDALLSLFWPEFDEAAARAALNRAVHHLRQSLGADVITSRGDQELAVARSQLTLNLFDLTEALEHGDAAAALALYEGDFLKGIHVDGAAEFDRWVEEERQRIRTAVAKAASDACRAAERSGDLATAVVLARRASDMSPYSESVILHLMRLLEAQGNRSEALQAHEAFVRRFKADLEADPDPEIQATADRIRHRRSKPVRPPSPPPGKPALPPPPGSAEGRTASSTRAGAGGSADHALRLVRREGEERAVDEEAPAPSPDRDSAAPAPPALVPDERRMVSPWRRFAPWVILAAALVEIGVLVVSRRAVILIPTVRFTLTIPMQISPTEFGSAIALSPNGADLVYVGWNDGRPQLFVRRLDQAAPRLLAGTEDGQAPFFSPDGQWIGYWAHGQLRKIPVDGGSSTPLVDVWWMGGATWLTKSRIVIGRIPTENGLSVIDASGGAPSPLAASEYGTRPIALPGGKFFLFIGNEQTITLAAIGDSAVTPLGVQGSPVGLLDKAMVYVRADGALTALPVDVEHRRVTGTPVQLLSGDLVLSAALAANGTLVYIRRSSGTRVMLVDLSGASTALTTEPADLTFPAVSPDGEKIAFTAPSSVGQSINVYDIPSKTLSRLTFVNAERPAWSRDGKWVGFTGVKASWIAANGGEIPADGGALDRRFQPFRIASDGSGVVDTLSNPISDLDAGIREVTFSPDGRFAVLRNDARLTRRDLWLLQLRPQGAVGTPVPLVRTADDELMPRVSPDGRHMVVISDVSGTYEIYIRPFPDAGPQFQVSDGGGMEPVWAPDGHGIFYRANGKMMLAVLSADMPLRVLDRRVLFDNKYLTSEMHQEYDVMPDGHHLVMLQPLQPTGEEGQSVVVVQGWLRELRRQLAPKPAQK